MTSIKNNDLRAKAIIDRTKRLLELDDLKTAMQVFQRINGIEMSDKKLFEDFRHTELSMLAAKRDFRSLEQQLKVVTFSTDQKNEKIYFTALINESVGNIVEAEKNYNWLSSANPYFDEAVVESARFFRTTSKERMKAYTILVNAVQANPMSIKILKAYGLEAFRMGFDDYSQSAFDRLVELIGQKAFTEFLFENRKNLTPQNN